MVELTTEDILKALRGNKQPPAMPMFEATNQALQPLGQGIKHTVSDIYERMKQAVTQGPGSSKSEYDPKIGMLAPELMLPAFGRALGGVGAAGGKILPLRGGKLPSHYTEEHLTDIASQLRNKAKNDPERSVYHLNDAYSVEGFTQTHERLQSKLKDIRELEGSIGNPDKLEKYSWNKSKAYRESAEPSSQEMLDRITTSWGTKPPVNAEEYIKRSQDTFKRNMERQGGPEGRLQELREEAQELQKHIDQTYKIIEQYGSGGTELGAFGGIKSWGGKTNWTPEMQARLKAIDEKYPKGTMGRQKTIVKEFREIYPEFGASDSTIQNMTSRMQNWGGINREGGVASVVPDPSEITSAQILEAMKKQNGPK